MSWGGRLGTAGFRAPTHPNTSSNPWSRTLTEIASQGLRPRLGR